MSKFIGTHWTQMPNHEEIRQKLRLAKLGRPRSGDPSNWKHSQETKKMLGDMQRGKPKPPRSEQYRKNISLGQMGRRASIETRQRISANRRGICTGEAHPNWRGGLTPVLLQIRHCYEYRQWRCDVFTRDEFICVLCGVRGGRLEADHYPKKFSRIVRESEIRTLEQAIDCQELWNINNGRTLCKHCHKQFNA